MEIIITLCAIVLVVTCFSIDGKLKKANEQNAEIIKLLKEQNKSEFSHED